MNIIKLREELSRDEGCRSRIYVDTVGKITGGVGRNLSDVPFSEDEIDLMLNNDITRAVSDLDKYLPWWRKMNDVRQRVLVNMCFMGIGNKNKGLLSFANTLNFMMQGNYVAAAQGMLNSKWAKQVGQRAVRLAKMMELGIDV